VDGSGTKQDLTDLRAYIGARFDDLSQRVLDTRSDVGRVHERLTGLDQRVGGLEACLVDMQARLRAVEQGNTDAHTDQRYRWGPMATLAAMVAGWILALVEILKKL